jgi:hypothetical protein
MFAGYDCLYLFSSVAAAPVPVPTSILYFDKGFAGSMAWKKNSKRENRLLKAGIPQHDQPLVQT